MQQFFLPSKRWYKPLVFLWAILSLSTLVKAQTDVTTGSFTCNGVTFDYAIDRPGNSSSFCTASNGSISVVASPAGSYSPNWGVKSGTSNVDGADGTYVCPTIKAGTYTLTVTVNGVSCTQEFPISYDAIGLPTANDVTICSGQTATLTATGCTSGYSWTESDANNAPVIGTGSTYTTPVLSATKDYYVACNSGGSRCPSTTDKVTVNVNPIPTVPTVSGSTTICEGGQATISATGCDGGTVNWLLNGSPTTVNNPITFNTPGTFTYTATCTKDGCTSSVSTTSAVITVNPKTTLTIAPTTICSDSPLSFPTTDANGAALPAGSWSPSTVSNTASGTYTYTPTNTCIQPATWTVTVNPKTDLNIAATEDKTICSGDAAPGFPSTNGISGTWSPATVSNTTTTTYTFTPAVGQCVNVVDATWTVTVNAPSTPTISGTSTVCPVGTGTSTTTLSASCTSGTLSWSTGATTASITVGAGTYTATCTIGDCKKTSENFTVTEVALSVPADITGSLTVCPSGTGTTTTTLTSSCASGTVTWSNGATTASITVGTGTYSVKCVNGACATAEKSVTVTEVALSAPADITGGLTVCPSGTGTTTTTLTSSCTSGTVTWSNGATTASITVGAGTYTVKCVNNSCESSTKSATVTEVALSAPADITGSLTVCPSGTGTTTTTLTSSCASGTMMWSNGATTASITVGAGTYTVKCVNGVCATAEKSVTVTEVALSAPADITGGLTVCPSGTGTTTTTLTSSCASGTIMWSNGATTASITVGAGTYTVKCVNGACETATKSATVTEVALSAPADITGNLSVCSTGTTTTTLTSSCASGTVTWSNGATTASITVGAGTYTVKCVNGACETATKSATVTAITVPTPTLTASQTTTCAATPTTLTATGCTGTLNWSSGATPVAGTNTATVTAPGTYTVTCSITSGGVTCTSTASNTITLTTPSISISGTKCFTGTPITLTVNGCTSDIVWSTGATTTSIDVTPTETITNYTVTCNVNGCPASASYEVIYVKPPTVSPSSGCVSPGKCITLTASGCDGPGSVINWGLYRSNEYKDMGNRTTLEICEPTGAGQYYAATCKIKGCTSDLSNKVIIYDCALPVKFTAFEGKVAEGGVKLSWTTAEELNLEHFEIERGENATFFKKVGELPAKNISGNNLYEIMDLEPMQGANYYRIKGVDFDGTLSVSRIITVIVQNGKSKDIEAVLYPNPVSITEDVLYLKTKNIDVRNIRIVSLNGLGQLTLYKQAGKDTFEIDMKGLKIGKHWLILETDKGLISRPILKAD